MQKNLSFSSPGGALFHALAYMLAASIFVLAGCRTPEEKPTTTRESIKKELADSRQKASEASASGSISVGELDTADKKYSYILGQDVGRWVSEIKKTYQFTLDRKIFFKSLNDYLQGRPALFTQDQMLAIKKQRAKELRKKWEELRKKEIAKRKALAEKNKKEAEKFFAENRKKTGVIETPSGLQYMKIKEGKGLKPGLRDRVTISFTTKLLDGTVVDSSEKRGRPLVFKLRNGIKGWREGIQLMREGSLYRFFIPSELAYGEWGRGSLVPPGAALICDIELIKVEKTASQKRASGN